MNPLPNGAEMMQEWERYYAGLKTDRAKLDFLLMLKQRRDQYADSEADKAVSLLATRWLAERFTG